MTLIFSLKTQATKATSDNQRYD